MATDDKTLSVTLNAPCSYFGSLAAFATLSPRDFFRRNIFNHKDFACLICTICSIRILNQCKPDTIKLNSVRIPVIRIFAEQNMRTRFPFCHIERSVRNISFRSNCPCIAVCFNRCLLYRAQSSKCSKASERSDYRYVLY